jgi:hypothetical protein
MTGRISLVIIFAVLTGLGAWWLNSLPPAAAVATPSATPIVWVATTSATPTSALCHSVGGRPDSRCTPGAVAETSVDVVCHRSTRTVRPPSSYTSRLKRIQLQQYDFTDQNPSNYEEDHLISLELGGDPTSSVNLWPEPYHTNDAIDLGAYTKDRFENYLHRQVCRGLIPLAEAQKEIAADWVRYWEAAGQP